MGCLVMHELKQIMISVLKSLIVAPLPVDTKKFCKALVDAPIRFFNSSKQTKNEEDRGLEL